MLVIYYNKFTTGFLEKGFEKPRQAFSSDCSPLVGSYADILQKKFDPNAPKGTEEKVIRDVLNTTERRENITDEQEVEEASAKKQKRNNDNSNNIMITSPSKHSSLPTVSPKGKRRDIRKEEDKRNT